MLGPNFNSLDKKIKTNRSLRNSLTTSLWTYTRTRRYQLLAAVYKVGRILAQDFEMAQNYKDGSKFQLNIKVALFSTLYTLF